VGLIPEIQEYSNIQKPVMVIHCWMWRYRYNPNISADRTGRIMSLRPTQAVSSETLSQKPNAKHKVAKGISSGNIIA
jgi:hypothetical protein